MAILKWAYNLSLFAIFRHRIYQAINVTAAVTVENVAPSDGKLSSLCSSGYHTAPSADLAGFEMACMQPSYSKLLYYVLINILPNNGCACWTSLRLHE